MNQKNLKKVQDFFEYRVNNWRYLTNYPDPYLKKDHGRKGKSALKALANLLELDKMKVDYNPSGVIDGGYLTLVGMKGEKGIYVSLSCSDIGDDVLYRTVEHMKDYTGGRNRFLTSMDFVVDPEGSVEAMAELLS